MHVWDLKNPNDRGRAAPKSFREFFQGYMYIPAIPPFLKNFVQIEKQGRTLREKGEKKKNTKYVKEIPKFLANLK